MQWAVLPHAMQHGKLWTWIADEGAPYPTITPDDIYNCFEAIFLGAVTSAQINRAGLNIIYQDLFNTGLMSNQLIQGHSRAFRPSSGWFPRVPERGDLVIFGGHCEHVVIATGRTVPGLVRETETEVISFWASNLAGAAPARVSRTTVEALSQLFAGLNIPAPVTFGPPRW